MCLNPLMSENENGKVIQHPKLAGNSPKTEEQPPKKSSITIDIWALLLMIFLASLNFGLWQHNFSAGTALFTLLLALYHILAIAWKR